MRSNDGTVYYQGGPLEQQYYTIETPEGAVRARFNDWIIQGVEGEIYPCKLSVFAKISSALRSSTSF